MASKPLALKLETDEMVTMKGKCISKQKQWEATVSLFCATSYELVALTAQDVAAVVSPACFSSTRLLPESPHNPDLVTLSFNTSVIFSVKWEDSYQLLLNFQGLQMDLTYYYCFFKKN